MEEEPFLRTLIEREFAQAGDIDQALQLVKSSNGIRRSRELAAHHAQQARQNLSCLGASASRESLLELIDYVLSRLY
jgi:all-trans-nonaprenyl-diphosphate synthase